MIRTLIICPDHELVLRLEQTLRELGDFSSMRTLEHYPDVVELSRTLRAHGPQLVLMGIQSVEYCTAAAAHIETMMPGLQVVAVGRQPDADVLMAIMRAGIREFLAMPFERTSVAACLDRVSANLKVRPMSMDATDAVFTFLPSKPGSGTSTLAVNMAVAMADEKTPTLLGDFDLNCGMMRFMLRLNSEYSVMDALQHAGNMDSQLWPQIVNKLEHVDILHAGRINPDWRVERHQVQSLLDFARRNYKVICADLSGNLEKYSLELMHESKKIFVVCTPEVSSLHLAREKMVYLQQMELSDRAVVLLNRQCRRSSMEPREVEKLVGAPVLGVFPNDYTGVSKAITDGKPLPKSSEYGKQCQALAELVLPKKTVPISEKRRFVEYFNIAPSVFSFEGRRSG